MGPWGGQGGAGMPGMGGGYTPGAASGGGNANIPSWMQNMTPDQLKAFWQLMQTRGTAGMRPNASPAGQALGQMRGPGGQLAPPTGTAGLVNPLSGQGGQQGIGQFLQNPQLLQYLLAQPQQGQFPQNGGGVDLLQMLGFPGR